ncbi:hypothetical protein SAMN04490195_3635 [Pseudomonas moorei]|jgi:beta-phosphoglucomutase-like phosphatase (HAD superfamily)|uniref:Uncharacterized protein n=1 Tax=Pseudomonas moorei TaxID=395599 RepID=A0A1H1GY57_9PSED|nr:hypothetical protein SAMN04490195_3635 [Pseudomonas moorei]
MSSIWRLRRVGLLNFFGEILTGCHGLFAGKPAPTMIYGVT